MTKRNFCHRLYEELTLSAEEEPATWSLARVRPSVALQMKTLNNLVAGCKSRREATLIDTRRRVPLRYTAPGTFMNARYESRDNNIARKRAHVYVCVYMHAGSPSTFACTLLYIVAPLMPAHCVRGSLLLRLYFSCARHRRNCPATFLRRSGNTLSGCEALSSAVITALPPRIVL